MKNKFLVLCLVCFIVVLAVISLSYLSKNNNADIKLTYTTEVSAVKYDDNNNAKLLSSTLQEDTSKDKEEMNASKEKKEQSQTENITKSSDSGNVTSQQSNVTSQEQNSGNNGTVVDGLRSIGSNDQVILVTASGYGTSIARIRTFEKINGKYSQALDISGYIGKYGFAEVMSESGMKSPRGKFSIGTAFGRFGNPGTKLSFRNITDNDYWVDDSNSSLYNTWQVGPVNGRWSSAEKMNIAPYNYGFVINYNTERTPGKGSAIFFHVSSGYTAGCTGTSQDNVIQILRWLDPSKNPVIIQCPEDELGNY